MQEIGGQYLEINQGIEDISTLRDKTNSEIESDVNDWYTAKGIS